MESRSSLKQRLARLFRPSSLLRSSCNSSSSGSIFTSSAANSSSRSLSTTSTPAANAAEEPAFIPHDSLFIRRLDRSLSFSSSSRVLSTLDCSGCGPNKTSEADVVSAAAKKERRVRETGEFYETGKGEGRTCPPASPASPAKDRPRYDVARIDEDAELEEGEELHKSKSKKKKKKKKKIFSTNAYGFSSSSDDGSEFFSTVDEVNGNEDETETFFSSRSFSSDSSEFYKRPSSLRKKKKKNRSSRIPPRRGMRPVVSASLKEEETEETSGAIPVLKRSADPYVDFRDSMAEMIVERQIFGAKGLENLLLSYLSLNSPRHHALILRAFSDISRVLFGH